MSLRKYAVALLLLPTASAALTRDADGDRAEICEARQFTVVKKPSFTTGSVGLAGSDISSPYLIPRIMAMTMMAVYRLPSEVMVTILMAMVHYMPVPWS